MQRTMRKYRHWILGFILLFIGVPMLFFGVPLFESATMGGDVVVGTIGGEQLYETALRRNLDVAARRFGGQNDPLTYAELAERGHADRVIEEMVDSALINIQQKKRNFTITNDTSAELMKYWEIFQDSNGNFDINLFNEWRNNQIRRNINWNELYDELFTQLDRQVFMNQALAPAYRLTEAELAQEIQKRTEKVAIRYAKVSPPIHLTDDEILAHYEENMDQYRSPDRRVAEFIAVGIASAEPTKAREVFQKLEEGEDFAELADTHGDHQIKNGGDLGWQVQLDDEEEHRLALFALEVGEVSELVEAPQGYFIYTVEDERINEETGGREVKARQIFLLKPDMSADERTAQSARMSQIVQFANENGIGAAADEYELPVQLSSAFDANSMEIEGVAREDVAEFRNRLQNATPEGNYVSIIGRDYNYCAKVAEVVPGEPRPFDEVREQVAQDLRRSRSLDDDYRNRKRAYAYRVAREAASIDQIAEIYPDAEIDTGETQPFGIQDNLFMQGLQLIATQIMDELKGKEPGDFAGPIRNFVGDYYFIELLDRTPDGDLAPEEIEEERENARNILLAQEASSYLQDYRIYLREALLPNTSYRLNDQRIGEILGLGGLIQDAAPTDEPAEPASLDNIPAINIPQEGS